MLIVKALLPLGTLLIAIIEIVLEHRWKEDTSPRRRTVARRALILLLCLTTGVTTYILYSDDKASSEQQRQINEQSTLLQDIRGQLQDQIAATKTAEEAHGVAVREQEDREKAIVSQLYAQERVAQEAEAARRVDTEHQKERQAAISRQLEEVLSIARSRYPNQTDSEAIASMLKRFGQLEAQADALAKKVAVPHLTLSPRGVTRRPEGLLAQVALEPSNKMPIGPIKIAVQIAPSSLSTIQHIGALGASMNVSTNIGADRRAATLTYTPVSNETQVILIGLSAPATIQFSGSHGIGTVELQVGE